MYVKVRGVNAMINIGEIINGRYKVLRQLPSASVGTYYLCVDESQNRMYNLREYIYSADASEEACFKDILNTYIRQRDMSHPSVASVEEIITTDNGFIAVTDYIPGESMRSLVDNKGPQNAEDAAWWCSKICDALIYLNSLDPPFTYCGLSPEKIIIEPSGCPVLYDLTPETVIDGVSYPKISGFPAPETYDLSAKPDIRSDIYSLGAILYYLITGYDPGKPPYKILPLRTINPMLPIRLEKVIEKCTKLNPDERYQNCESLKYHLGYGDAPPEKPKNSPTPFARIRSAVNSPRGLIRRIITTVKYHASDKSN